MKLGKVLSVTILLVGMIGLVAGWLVWRWVNTTPRQNNANTSAAAEAHEFYGVLYDAAWRGDDGIGEATMSATLLTPGLKTAMVNDSLRGSLDTQVTATFDADTKDQIAILVGMDAVVGSNSARLPDASLRDAISLTVADRAATLAELIPLVVTDLPTTNSPTIQRRWVAFYTPTESFSWTSEEPLRLRVNNIGNVPTRTFTWVNPALLNNLATTD